MTKAINSPLSEINNEQIPRVSHPLALICGQALLEKPKDLFIPADALEITLESFEGPLDLLLYLINKQQLDILALPIATISKQYMSYIELIEHDKLAAAADYLVMAALLAEIKSRLLLPKQIHQQQEDDPRAELVRRLQQYQEIKQAAILLDNLPRLERDSQVIKLPLSASSSVSKQPLKDDLNIAQLAQAMHGISSRNKAYKHFHVAKESLSTSTRMEAILAKLHAQTQGEDSIDFVKLCELNQGKEGVVVTFLALLELIKDKEVNCWQQHLHGTIAVGLPRNVVN